MSDVERSLDKRIPVGVLGATGMVGQRFEVACVAASPRSAGKTYQAAVEERWVMKKSIPPNIAGMNVLVVERDMDKIAAETAVVFSALEMEKWRIRALENQFAS